MLLERTWRVQDSRSRSLQVKNSRVSNNNLQRAVTSPSGRIGVWGGADSRIPEPSVPMSLPDGQRVGRLKAI